MLHTLIMFYILRKQIFKIIYMLVCEKNTSFFLLHIPKKKAVITLQYDIEYTLEKVLRVGNLKKYPVQTKFYFVIFVYEAHLFIHFIYYLHLLYEYFQSYYCEYFSIMLLVIRVTNLLLNSQLYLIIKKL
jgi:hypothetical protein